MCMPTTSPAPGCCASAWAAASRCRWTAARSGADRLLRHGEHVAFGARQLQVRATPGHTNGCLSYVLDDESRVFSGDCLLIRGCGRTDFQQGDTAALYRSVHMQLFTLPGRLPGVPGA